VDVVAKQLEDVENGGQAFSECAVRGMLRFPQFGTSCTDIASQIQHQKALLLRYGTHVSI
jgi:hypothetical protein